MNADQYLPFSEMVRAVGFEIEDRSAGRAEQIKLAINRAYSTVLAKYEWPQLVRVVESGKRSGDLGLDSLYFVEGGEAEVPLPNDCGRIKKIQLVHPTPSTIELLDPEELFSRLGSSLDTTGVPRFACEVGTTAQFARHEEGRASIIADSPDNDGQRTLRIGLRIRDGLTAEVKWEELSGAFSAGLSIAGGRTLPAGYPIESVEVPEGWHGHIRIQGQTGQHIGSVESDSIPESDTVQGAIVYRRKLYRLGPVPDVDYRAVISYWRTAPRLTRDRQRPLIPVSAYLIESATASMLTTLGKPQPSGARRFDAASTLDRLMGQNKPAGRRAIRPRRGNLIGGTDSPVW